jgi:DNA-binding beta-propeller fold protein YncE
LDAFSFAPRTANFAPTYSTASRRLIYVDAVTGVAGSPSVDGTIVIDLDGNAPLGVIEGHHVVGISPDGSEFYMAVRSVFGTSLHQQTRTLAFSLDIVSNGFLVAPDGTRLYSHNERLDVATNTLLANLPVDITTGSSWDVAPIPGGPAISPDGGRIFCNNNINVIDTVGNAVTDTRLSGSFLSDLALSEDGTKLLVSVYGSGSGNVSMYDANTFASLGSASGLGDFAGEVKAVPGGKFAVVGSSGNPASPSGFISALNLQTYAVTSHASLPLGDNLAVSSNGEVIASSGETALFQRAGVGVYLIDAAGGLHLEKTFFLGINAFQSVVGRPTNDQIRRIVLKQTGAAGISGNRDAAVGDGPVGSDGMLGTGGIVGMGGTLGTGGEVEREQAGQPRA